MMMTWHPFSHPAGLFLRCQRRDDLLELCGKWTALETQQSPGIETCTRLQQICRGLSLLTVLGVALSHMAQHISRQKIGQWHIAQFHEPDLTSQAHFPRHSLSWVQIDAKTPPHHFACFHFHRRHHSGWDVLFPRCWDWIVNRSSYLFWTAHPCVGSRCYHLLHPQKGPFAVAWHSPFQCSSS